MARERIRVLLLIGFLSDRGGAERFVQGLATHLPRDRFEPWVCFPRGASPGPIAELREAGIPHLALGRRSKLDFYRFIRLVQLLRKERFDILHTHLFGSNFWGTSIGRACGVPVVIAHEHTWAYQGWPLRAWLDGHLIGRLATRFVAVSEADARRMVEYEGVPKEKVVVMPTAYIPRAAAPAGPDIRGELRLDGDTPLVATAALLRAQKAIDVLLDAHALLRREIPDAQLVIAGDGPQADALREHAQHLQLNGSVHFLGPRQDVEAILSSADVAALSSDFEGTPLFAFECMAARTPLVATAVGGVPDLIQDGRTGLLVPPRDPRALASALGELLRDPPRRQHLASAAVEQLPQFTIDRVALQFADLYEQLLRERRR